ncbi:MAG: DNA polymerase III subunit alpha, partial [Gammaproteobacteria bacterium]|nr:DNA polymerase III subunit alpha [Gammaproteobacteria bacterium]
VLKDQWKAQEVLLAIQRKAKWNDPKRWKFGFTGLHLRTESEMAEKFEKQRILSKRQYTIAMMNTLKIAEQCWDFKIKKQLPDLPLTRYEKEFPNLIADDILDQFCSKDKPALDETGNWHFKHWERYQKEMKLIQQKGFARYFLIVYEIIQFCEQQNIPIGPGRGSAGGSLVAFLLGITQVDPLKYDLLFERFISENRIDYPDIDIDFDRNRVDEVINHLREEYGEYNVAGISTFTSMQGRGAIRDVSRVFELPAKEVDQFAKAIKYTEHKENIILHSEENGIGRDFAQKYPEAFQLACDLEGQIRGSGQHPAGLIISKQDLRKSDKGNLILRNKTKVINWDMEDCDYIGLMKIDILKLNTLSVLNEIKRLIKKDFQFEDLSFDDPVIFKLLSEGKTAGIFQVTGYACTKLCTEMRIDNFNDIVTVVALARPGPQASGMTEQYVKRKHGLKWEPLHPIYEAITKDTFGVMVYQEQMMQAMVDLAGFSGSDADQIRKVIGKKRDAKEFEPYRIAFLEGCEKKKTLTKLQAEIFWKGLLEWAHYGFNKAHAVSYAIIGYWTSYAKVYYPTEFICASLTYGDEADKENLIKEAQNQGIQVITPKVGISEAARWIIKDNNLYMPFTEIKGIGEKEAEKCLTERPIRQGFFPTKKMQKSDSKGQTQKMLQEIKAFDPDPLARPENCLAYFQFDIGNLRKGKR